MNNPSSDQFSRLHFDPLTIEGLALRSFFDSWAFRQRSDPSEGKNFSSLEESLDEIGLWRKLKAKMPLKFIMSALPVNSYLNYFRSIRVITKFLDCAGNEFFNRFLNHG